MGAYNDKLLKKIANQELILGHEVRHIVGGYALYYEYTAEEVEEQDAFPIYDTYYTGHRDWYLFKHVVIKVGEKFFSIDYWEASTDTVDDIYLDTTSVEVVLRPRPMWVPIDEFNNEERELWLTKEESTNV